MDLALPFRDFAAFERESYVSTTIEVYEVAEDATARKMSLDDVGVEGGVKYNGDGAPYESPDGIVDAPTVWEALKGVNLDGQAVGRITIVQEPTPLILAALHLTMSPHFDMPELLSHLLSEAPNRGRTHAFMHRAFERAPSAAPRLPPSPALDAAAAAGTSSFARLRQRSFFFVFKYYTPVGEGLEPAPWQRFDKRPVDKRLGDHIDIAECSSVLALSLGGEPTKPLWMRPRRERAKEGFLFDTFGPWHLLSIQSFPDDHHTVRGDDFLHKSFYNGPYAFLDLLVSEYRDAGKRNQILHERITKLITPPTEFMFDRRLRDKLLFEDKHFTYIRRYFWAYNTLAVINTGIKAMVAAYVDTFTDDFWAGAHPLLWPHPAPASPEGLAYRDRMAVLRRELDKVVAELGEVLKRNERTRKEIENLRDQLFSGSSIKESRRAIDQGDNIQILTTISMVFLPLTFVTSVFGITEFTIPATDWRFPVTMVLVCVPFMLVVFLFQTRGFTVLLRKIRSGASYLALSLPSALAARLRDQGGAADGRSTAPPRGRKRRLMAAAERAEGRTGRWWRGPWGRHGTGGEDVDLGRV
ncbi:Uncharacterized protein TPAR_06436 [Tolypocladium paradoxum]|uniref:Magnesium transport protein CorA, transmembrane region n=1 Tax=Tolypocladium paradoxum TaxID=94208 RepID=A0A2S4KT48_9HYPO|nr:Uncharacterized protein TPAR_06436 [Tolypocladium paradoxum]